MHKRFSKLFSVASSSSWGGGGGGGGVVGRGRPVSFKTCLYAAVLALPMVPAIAAAQISYDTNGDNLIEVTTATQLQAITHDLAGIGTSTAAAWLAAFPNAVPGMGCPGTCKGYELLNDIDLSGMVWEPIGGGTQENIPVLISSNIFGVAPDSIRYKGVFEGNGYIIRGLRVERSGAWNYLGLFSALGQRRRHPQRGSGGRDNCHAQRRPLVERAGGRQLRQGGGELRGGWLV